jgi:hypothetical protein
MRTKILFLLAALVAAGSATAQVTIVPIVSIAPRYSPSITPYNQNALFAIRNGLDSYNSSSDPTRIFEAVTGPIMIDSIYGPPTPSAPEFNMWRGVFDPGTALGSAYALQAGNSLSFGFMITHDSGQQVSLGNLAINASSPGGISTSAVIVNYTSSFAGLNKGLDGILFTADDVLVSSGSKTQFVDALIGRGGGAFSITIPESTPGATWLDRVEYARANRGSSPIELTIDYSYIDALAGINVLESHSQTLLSVAAVPEPSAYAAIIGAAVLGLALVRRKKPA